MKKSKTARQEWEILYRKRRFYNLFCPYEDKDIEKAIEICINNKLDENLLYELSKNNTQETLTNTINNYIKQNKYNL